MKKIGILIALLALVSIPFASSAAEFHSGQAYLLDEGEVLSSNLYVGGESVDVRGQVFGDVVSVAGEVTLTGPVVGDVIVGGGTIKLLSSVNGDVRLAGGTVSISENVSGDLLVFGGQISVEPTASIAGDVLIYGGSVKISGPVQGEVRVIGGDVLINSAVAGDVLVQAERLTIGQKGVIAGDLDYRSGNKNNLVNDGQVKGKINVKADPILPEERQIGAFLGALASTWLVLRILMSILGALAIYFLFRYRLTQAVGEALSRPWRSLLVGFVVAVVTPVLAIVLLASVFGIMFAGVLALVYLAVILMAYILTGTYFGAWAHKLITKSSEFVVDWRTIILGTLGLTVIGFIPVVGWIFCLGFFLIALASLVERFYRLLTE